MTEDGDFQKVLVDAIGELSEVGSEAGDIGYRCFVSCAKCGGKRSVFRAPGLTGTTGSGWQPVGWRQIRAANGEDPWSVPTTPTAGHGNAESIAITGHGTPVIAGLEWMGARVYDPGVRGFLSVDPLPPVVGAGWAGNSYSYAGDDPLHALDPHGLSPLTDPELFDFQTPQEELRGWAQSDEGRNWSFLLSTVGILSPVAAVKARHPFLAGGIVIGGYLASTASTAIDCLAAPNSPACIVGSVGVASGPVGAIFSRIPKFAGVTSDSIKWVADIVGWNADALNWITSFADWWEREL